MRRCVCQHGLLESIQSFGVHISPAVWSGLLESLCAVMKGLKAAKTARSGMFRLAPAHALPSQQECAGQIWQLDNIKCTSHLTKCIGSLLMHCVDNR